jgi:hypothetical protein
LAVGGEIEAFIPVSYDRASRCPDAGHFISGGQTVKPLPNARNSGRAAALTVGSLVALGAMMLPTGCSRSTEPAPAPSSSPSASVSVRPTEKGVLPNPPKAFNQNMNAADGISALQSEGYNVEINWGGGRTDQNLSLCRIGAVDGLRGSGAIVPGTSVYVTVIC